MTLRKAFDGEVYYWYEDDPVERAKMSRVDPLRFVNAKIYTQADLDQARKEAREAAFAEIGVEMRRYGANIRKVDLMARFQELFRESEAAASTQERG